MSEKKKKILVTATNYDKYCQSGKKILQNANCEIVENPYGRPMTFNELSRVVGDIDGVVVGVDEWNEHIFELAPHLKGMARFGVGVDNINLSDAKKYGIKVCNCPGINTNAVAEQTVGLILSATRSIPLLNKEIRTGSWTRVMNHELCNQTIGLLGFGAIAKSVAEKLQGFHTRILAYDKFPDKETAKKLHVEFCSFEELLSKSDILSIHVPASNENRHLLNEDTLRKVKPGVILINTARGTIIDEEAALAALNSGIISLWATDVFEYEPIKPDLPAFQYDQYIATPHTSAETYENYDRTSIITAKALLDILEGKEPVNRLV
ncbi:phosphoglycerate dehydrogenase [Blautia glucerasea]|uniref:phosphoglycerate dehydrogenase n=1 Tax=Blautia glucerasea TaxID=536633 RepID=UPI0015707307|nr:phosphoglycerate dehydrogenase [Blautia glucerasea]NSJ28294.1 phosphoglycerate dehydrogenase [Blautia glucerasea]